MRHGFKKHHNSLNLPELMPRLKSSLNRIPDYSYPEFLTANIANEGPYIVAGEGLKLETNEGKKILDFASMTLNCSLGQNDPWVKICMMAYLESDIPSFLTTRLKSPIYCSYPERLVRLGVGGIRNPRINHRQCNGSDVTELALKAASIKAGNRRKVVSFRGGYHGQNLISYFVSEKQKHLRFLCEDEACAVFLPEPDHAETDDQSLSSHDREILSSLQDIIDDVFAVILEPIQMNNGVLCISPAFLAELRAICDKHDVCLIYDEVQTGFGWLGAMTAAELYGIIPDISCLSKGITAGYGPMAVMIAREKYSELPYGSGEKTNGSDLRALVSANAVLDRLTGIEDRSLLPYIGGSLAAELDNGLIGRVPEKAQIFKDHLSRIGHDNKNVINSVRSKGLIGGIEIVKSSKDFIPTIMDETLERGLFIRKTANWLVIKPPVTITRQEMAEAFGILGEVLSSLERGDVRTAD